MAKSAVDLIANRINELQRNRKAMDIAINELQSVLQSLGGTPIIVPKSLDAQWGTDAVGSNQVAVSGSGKTADGKAPEVVASPKSGTPVETGVAVLRKKLGGNGR